MHNAEVKCALHNVLSLYHCCNVQVVVVGNEEEREPVNVFFINFGQFHSFLDEQMCPNSFPYRLMEMFTPC